MRKPVAAVLLCLMTLQVACYTVRPVPELASFVTAQRPARLWVTRKDNSTVIVDGPTMKGDSLLGFVNNRYQVVGRLPDLQRVDARHPAKHRTALLVGGIGVGVAALVVVLLGAGSSEGPTSDCTEEPDACP